MSVEAQEDPRRTLVGSGLVDGLVPQFRVVAAGEKRRGLRLERVFWRVLDELAKRRGLKVSGLVTEILDQSDAAPNNVASTLRCYAVAAIDAERQGLVDRSSPAQTIALMQQAPMPAFAINRQKKLQQVNAEFMQLLRPSFPSGETRNTAEFVHLSLDTPIGELFLAASAAPSTQCSYTLQVDDRRRRGVAKLVLVPADKPDMLVGYVLP